MTPFDLIKNLLCIKGHPRTNYAQNISTYLRKFLLFVDLKLTALLEDSKI